jgi:hypothetical protein
MSARKAKRHLNECEDYLVFTVVKGNMYVDYQNNASLNILGDLAVANKDFAKYLEEVLTAINNHESTTEESKD